MNDNNSEKEENNSKKVHKSLKDNPRPFATPALRKKKENELHNKPNKVYKNQILPSILTQPNINKEKQKEKELRNMTRVRESKEENNNYSSKGKEKVESEDILVIDNEIEDLEMNKDNQQNKTNTLEKLISTKTKETNNENTQLVKRNIKMMNNKEPYNIMDDLNNLKSSITIGQLLNACPKIRSQLTQGLKLEKSKIIGTVDNVIARTLLVNNYDHSYISKSNEVAEEDLAMVDASVDGVLGKLLIDSCSNLSIVTKQYFDKLPGEYETVGKSRGRIQLATQDEEYSEGIIVRLPVKINNYEFNADFRIIEKEDSFYDMLINFKTQIDHCLFIHPTLNSLCKLLSESEYEEIAKINNQYYDEESIICTIRKVKETNNEKEIIKELTPMEFIESDEFLSTLNKDYKEQIIKILKEMIDIVATSTEELTPSKLSPHKIRLKANAKPVKLRSYRLTKLKSDILKEELTKLIKKGLIEPSCSEWSSPVVLILKHNGKWRLCIDYRKVNDMTEKDSYSVPYIDEIFDSLGGAKIFTTLDLFSGFHQILMDEESVEVTTFTTKFGNYQFKVMPFGLTGAPSTFQREMNKILFPFIGEFVYVFIDDVLIYSKSIEEHLIHIKQVLEVFKENKLKINIEKCHFLQTEVDVLGHKLTTKGLSPMESKITAIKKWEAPSSLHELRSFLGAVGYYRDFIPKYAQITSPLCKLLKKNTKYEWNKEQQESFELLKEKLINAPILKFPSFDKPFIIRTDASYNGIGGVLLQKEEETGKEHPIHFISRSLKKAEKNYGITDLEGTALFYCMTKFKSYIEGNPLPTTIYTDHKPLVGLFKNKEPLNARQTRWCLTASMLGINIKYESGKKNVLADALSRMKSKEERKILLTKITNGNNEELLSKVIKEFINEKFTVIDGEDYFIDNGNYRKLITDENERFKLILEAHNIGHEGYYKTYQRLKKNFYWNHMIKDIKRIVSNCEKCQLNRPQPYPEPTENHPTKVEGPFVHLGLDIIGPLPKTRNNNQYIIVTVDYFTKWVEAEPTENITSSDIIKFLINVFARHGVPQVITTDNGVQFTSDMTKIFLDLYDVYVKFVATYHPESNGLTENRNKEIGKLLRLLGRKNQDWDEVLPSALWALRTTKNTATGHSSFELVYGREDQQPYDIAIRTIENAGKSYDEILMEKFVRHYQWTREACENVKNANKYWATRREEQISMKKGKELKAGDLVLVRNFSRTKLEPYYNGPFKILKIQFNTATLIDQKTGKQLDRNVHFKNLVKFNSAYREA